MRRHQQKPSITCLYIIVCNTKECFNQNGFTVGSTTSARSYVQHCRYTNTDQKSQAKVRVSPKALMSHKMNYFLVPTSKMPMNLCRQFDCLGQL